MNTPKQPTAAEHEHDEHMRQIRAEFATKVWPKISKEVGHPMADMACANQAAWLGFLAGKGQNK